MPRDDRLAFAAVGYRVFSRVDHGTSTVIVEYWCHYLYNAYTVRVGWLPFFVQNCTRQSRDSVALGDWPWETSGGDMLRHNVRFTPLPGFGDTDALDVLTALPAMCVFSSDFPHQEGNADPIALYGDALDQLDGNLRRQFLGANALEWFARMGDPLPDV